MSDTHTCSGEKGGFGSFLKIIAGIILFGLVTGSIFCTYRSNNKTYDQARAIERAKKLSDLRAKESVILSGYAVVDEAKGVYHIPIEKSMELEVEALKNKPLRPAGVIVIK